MRAGTITVCVGVLGVVQVIGAGCDTEEGPASCEELMAGDLVASDGDPCSGSWSCYIDGLCAPSSSYFCEMGHLRVDVSEPMYTPGCPDAGYVVDAGVLDAEAGVLDGALAEGGAGDANMQP